MFKIRKCVVNIGSSTSKSRKKKTKSKSFGRYDIRPGTDDVGRDYEIQIIAYLALRCLNEKVKNFWIANNADGLEAFDDIILYRENVDNTKQLVLMQLKHKIDPSKAPFAITKKDFNLIKYENSFHTIESLLKCLKLEECCGTVNTHKLLISTNVDPSNFVYIFFTNNKMRKTNHLVQMKPRQYLELLDFQVGKECVFKINYEKMNCKCKEDSSFVCSKNFYSQFFLFAEQCGVRDMENVIAEELKNIFPKLDLKPRLCIGEQFVNFLKDTSSDDRNEFREVLTKKGTLKLITKLLFTYYSYEPMHFVGDRFTEDSHKIWRKLTENYQVVLVPKGNKFVDHIISENPERISIIPCYKCFDSIKIALKLYEKAKITLIATEKEMEEFRMSLIDESITCFSRLEQFPVSVVPAIENCTLYFQGKQTKFKAILQHEVPRMFTTDIILNLLGNNLYVGEKTYKLPTTHVLRSIPRITVKSDVFNLVQCKFIVVDPAGRFSKFSMLVNNKDMSSIVNVVQDEKDIGMVMSDLASNTQSIHILKLHVLKDDYVLEWIHSKTSNIDDMKPYLNKSNHLSGLPSVTDFVSFFAQKYKNKILIVGKPGMGKTIFLNYLSRIYPTKHWVLHIAMNDIDFLQVQNFQSLLIEYKKDFDPFSVRIFETMLQKKMVTVFLDGFDEVAPTYINESSSIVMNIIAAELPVVVTSRPVTKKQLTKLLNVPAYSLDPYNNSDQHRFLHQYYRNYLKTSSIYYRNESEIVEQFAEDLLYKIQKSVWNRSFLEIPLQCRMLAEAFLENFMKYFETGKLDLPDNLTVIHLYELFVQKKFRIYWQEKLKIDCATSELKLLLDSRMKEIENNHMVAALNVIFPTMNVEVSEKFLEEVKTGHDKCGLIVGVTKSNRAVFLHRTFAEYFTALWLYRNGKDHPDLMKLLLQRKFYVIRNVLDRIYCKENEFHMAVLNNNIVAVKTIMEENLSKPNTALDNCECGRTAMHLVSARGAVHRHNHKYLIERDDYEHFRPILELLLNNGFWNDQKDDMMKWTPLQYVEHNYAVGFVDLFFKYQVIADCSVFNLWKPEVVLRICAKYDYPYLAKAVINHFGLNAELIKMIRYRDKFYSLRSDSILHISAHYSSLRMIEFSLEYIEIDAQNSLKQTPLHLACKGGHLSSVKKLIENGANPFLEEDYRRIPLDIAVAWNYRDIEEYLTSYDILKLGFVDDVNKPITSYGDCALHLAAKGRNISTILKLIENGAFVDATNKWEMTPMHVACEEGILEAVKLLIDKKANVYAEETLGYIPLDKCNHAKHAQLMEYLSSFPILKMWFGDDVNKTLPKTGRTALHLATAAGNAESVRLLLVAGADVNATSTKWKRWTALHFAVYEGYLDVVKVLLKFNADTDLLGIWHFGKPQTPLAFARLKGGRRSIFECLYQSTSNKSDADLLYFTENNSKKEEEEEEEEKDRKDD